MFKIVASLCILVAATAALPREQAPQQPQPQQRAPAGQDPTPTVPRPAPAPADAPRLPLVQEPYVEPVPRLDLPMRFQPRDPLEGFWELRQRNVGGQPVPAGRGMIAIGRSHLMVQFESPGSDPELPLLRAGAYSWLRGADREEVRLTVLESHFNDDGGKVHLEPVGSMQIRRFELLGNALRVHQSVGSWLEFVRVE